MHLIFLLVSKRLNLEKASFTASTPGVAPREAGSTGFAIRRDFAVRLGLSIDRTLQSSGTNQSDPNRCPIALRIDCSLLRSLRRDGTWIQTDLALLTSGGPWQGIPVRARDRCFRRLQRLLRGAVDVDSVTSRYVTIAPPDSDPVVLLPEPTGYWDAGFVSDKSCRAMGDVEGTVLVKQRGDA